MEFKSFKMNASRLVADKLALVLPSEVKSEIISQELFKYLSLPDEEGNTVAHHLVKRGFIFEPKGLGFEVLTLSGKDGWTVAHEQARRFDFTRWGYEGKRLLSLRNNKGWTVAHEQVKNGVFFDPVRHRELMIMSDDNGWTVAHEFVKQGGFIGERGLMLYDLKDNRGISVAQVALAVGSRMALEVLRYPHLWDDWGVTDAIEAYIEKHPDEDVKLMLFKLIVHAVDSEEFVEEVMKKIDSIFEQKEQNRENRERERKRCLSLRR